MLAAVELLRSILPAQRNGDMQIRHAALAVDPNLSGLFRFCYARGNSPAILASSNSTTITEGVHLDASELVTTDTPPDDWSDCIVMLSGSESVWVRDMQTVTDDAGVETTTLTLDQPTINTHVAGMRCTLSAFRVVAVENYSVGTLSLELQTTRILVPGDRLGVMTNSVNVPTLTRYIRIATARRTAITDAGLSTYAVTLADPLLHEINADTNVFIEARPAYESRQLSIPYGFRPSFVAVDVHGGETFGRGVLTADVFVTTLSADGKIANTGTVGLNDWFRLNPLQAHELAAACVDRGALAWSGNVLSVTLDDDGLAGFGVVLDSEQDLSSALTVISESACSVAVDTTLDKSPVWHNIAANAATPVAVTATTRVVVLRISGAAGQVVKFMSKGVLVNSLVYSICVELHENEVFECSGLLLKPMLYSVDPCITNNIEVQGESVVLELNKGTLLC